MLLGDMLHALDFYELTIGYTEGYQQRFADAAKVLDLILRISRLSPNECDCFVFFGQRDQIGERRFRVAVMLLHPD